MQDWTNVFEMIQTNGTRLFRFIGLLASVDGGVGAGACRIDRAQGE